jgi:hypothetical protein
VQVDENFMLISCGRFERRDDVGANAGCGCLCDLNWQSFAGFIGIALAPGVGAGALFGKVFGLGRLMFDFL